MARATAADTADHIEQLQLMILGGEPNTAVSPLRESSALSPEHRVPRPPTPAEAQPCHTRGTEGRRRIHASSDHWPFIERDNWSLRR